MPSADQVLAEMRSLGDDRIAAIYRRHGATTEVVGVRYGDIDHLVKRLGADHTLADDLWASGVHEGRVVAIRVADPERFTARGLDAWVRDLDCYVLVEELAKVVAPSPVGATRAAAWRSRKGEWARSLGWAVTAGLALSGGVAPDDAHALLDEVLDTIDGQANRVRHEMNGAVIAIGVGVPEARDHAFEVAAAISPVDVDHGETGCVTPDAVPYMRKAIDHAEARDARRAAKRRAMAAGRARLRPR